jgi:hypothetical protein
MTFQRIFLAPVQVSRGCTRLLGCGLVLLAGTEPSASAEPLTSSPQPRYQLEGSGSIVLNPPTQTAGKFGIAATLDGANAASNSPGATWESGRFAMRAALAATVVACYNDTIFRDDFDGDGL